MERGAEDGESRIGRRSGELLGLADRLTHPSSEGSVPREKWAHLKSRRFRVT